MIDGASDPHLSARAARWIVANPEVILEIEKVYGRVFEIERFHYNREI